jgi:hypothetical protein
MVPFMQRLVALLLIPLCALGQLFCTHSGSSNEANHGVRPHIHLAGLHCHSHPLPVVPSGHAPVRQPSVCHHHSHQAADQHDSDQHDSDQHDSDQHETDDHHNHAPVARGDDSREQAESAMGLAEPHEDGRDTYYLSCGACESRLLLERRTFQPPTSPAYDFKLACGSVGALDDSLVERRQACALHSGPPLYLRVSRLRI